MKKPTRDPGDALLADGAEAGLYIPEKARRTSYPETLPTYDLLRVSRSRVHKQDRIFRTTPPPSNTIANTGAMHQVGQKRSKEIAALAAEPGCG
jgi:hypothetical protein